MACVFGSIRRTEVADFLKLCDDRGWIIVENDGNKIAYLDRNMDKHKVTLSDTDSDLFIM